MNNHYTYFLILALSLAGPLALSFDKKVHFYKKWKYIFPAMLLPAVFYIAWDSYFTAKHVWSFNENYISGYHLFNLPVEEILFFFIVPYCCVFIYECVRTYFPLLRNNANADKLLRIMGVILFLGAIIFHKKYYPSWTFFLNSAFILVIHLLGKRLKHFDAISFLVSYAICLVPFLIVNGLLTGIPVVIYNDAENLGIRLYTIPFEDIFYGMLLVLMNIVLFEQLRHRKLIPPDKKE